MKPKVGKPYTCDASTTDMYRFVPTPTLKNSTQVCSTVGVDGGNSMLATLNNAPPTLSKTSRGSVLGIDAARPRTIPASPVPSCGALRPYAVLTSPSCIW